MAEIHPGPVPWEDPGVPPRTDATDTAAPKRGRPGKRDAIDRAARRVFGRDGYVRASIDAIAAEAEVSTRTIYNHFPGKEQLFTSVLHDSAAKVADTFVDMVGRLDAEGDLDTYLLGLARALVAQSTEHPEHFTMVRRIQAEADLFPPEAIAAWHRAGPQRVESEVARRLGDLAERGVLQAPDPRLMARHFIALTAAQATPGSPARPRPRSRAELDAVLAAGIHAFLHGYTPTPA
jgi:AcrR family transcriptional regulator